MPDPRPQDDLTPTDLKLALTQRLRDAGFDAVGVASPDGIDPVAARRFACAAASADYEMMGWLARTAEARINPLVNAPWAKSVVMVAAAYGCDGSQDEPNSFARYARLPDYHDWVRGRLESVAAWLHDRVPESQHDIMVDSGPIAEKLFASAAGLGWIGRNTLLLNPRYGSWMVLGTLLTSIEFEPDGPTGGSCGPCTACIDTCPTGALSVDGGLDPRKCYSYLTVESRVRSPLLDRDDAPLFGCDICQEVCPHNATPVGGVFGMEPRVTDRFATIDEYRALSEDDFRHAFADTPIERGLKRGHRGA